MGSKDDLPSSEFAAESSGKTFSVLASLSSLLGADRIVPRGPSNGIPNRVAGDKDVAVLLSQTQHQQYTALVPDTARPVTPPLHIYGDSQILTARQLKELRHVRLPCVINSFIYHILFFIFCRNCPCNLSLQTGTSDTACLQMGPV